jgi:hypothetical protein
LGVAPDSPSLRDALACIKLFKIHSTFNALLAEPMVQILPGRIYRATLTGLRSDCLPNDIAKLIEDWVNNLRTSSTERVCHCCKLMKGGINECVLCEEMVCTNCSLNKEDMEQPNFSLRDTQSRRRNEAERKMAATPDEIKPVDASEGDISEGNQCVCHLCTGVTICPLAVVEGATRHYRLANSVGLVGAGADFKLKRNLKMIGLPASDDFVVKLLHKCLQDRSLANGLLSPNTEERLAAMKGHIFPFPINYCPNIKPSLMAALPKDIFN